MPRISFGQAAAGLATVLTLAGCTIAPTSSAVPVTEPVTAESLGFVPDLPVSAPPFKDVHASWKQRLDQLELPGTDEGQNPDEKKKS